jgi:hypothetical protein
MIKDLVQLTLDTALTTSEIRSYDQRKSGPDASQYIVYSQLGDSEESFSDDAVDVKNAGITLKYYYRAGLLDNKSGRLAVRQIEDLIESSMLAAGFNLPFGKFDAGDVDDIEYFVTVFEFEYWRVV